MTNIERVQRAQGAVAPYLQDAGDERTAIVDVIADLMHLAAASGYEFESITTMAEIHFNAERGD